jgi:hypothetical protein
MVSRADKDKAVVFAQTRNRTGLTYLLFLRLSFFSLPFLLLFLSLYLPFLLFSSIRLLSPARLLPDPGQCAKPPKIS